MTEKVVLVVMRRMNHKASDAKGTIEFNYEFGILTWTRAKKDNTLV